MRKMPGGCCVSSPAGGMRWSAASGSRWRQKAVSHAVTAVEFDPLTDADIAAYLATGEPFGKAGAYAIQGRASAFIRSITGDYFNVVGLPVNCLCNLFRDTFHEALI